jgi:hypothetical protein
MCSRRESNYGTAPERQQSANVGLVSKGAGQAGWQRAIEARLSKFQQPGLSLRQMALIWAAAFSVVVLACAAFFITLYWLFS